MRTSAAAILFISALSSGAMAQITTTGAPASPDAKTSQQSGGQQSVTRPNTDKMAPNGTSIGSTGNTKLEKGANSFTEGEVRSRLDKAGFKDAKDLKKDADGIWHGTAMRDGKPTPIGVDFKGNVAAQ